MPLVNSIRNGKSVPRLDGVVDGIEGGVLRGWAWLPGQDKEPVHIEIQSGQDVIGRARADIFREDLAAAGKRNGYCAFAITLKPAPSPGAKLSVLARVNGKLKELPGSPLPVPAEDSSAVQRPAIPDVDVLPIPIVGPGLRGSLDQCGPMRIRGWVQRINSASQSPTLSLQESGRELVNIEPNQWRSDVAEHYQNDGYCGFDLPLPDALRDGERHLLDLCTTENGKSALVKPFVIQFRKHAPLQYNVATPCPLLREKVTPSLTLSVIVNFYNMDREAARTLISLGKDYQIGAQELDYEVLCIDNGSSPPLDPKWISSFGPQFQLIRPSAQHASPCKAINEAALKARGRFLAIMIDGAHLLTPGVFLEARKAWKEQSDAVVAVRHWFVGGDQRWLASVGYSRVIEDQLFERIRWPSSGYELFRIGAPIGENPEPWFDGLSESNCLMLPTDLYDRIGGMDEAFDEAGGGFANLDLWRRASAAAEGPLVSLVGEASFHQFHGGTTTNVDDAEKDVRVRAYANAYRARRGEEFTSVHRSRLSFRGSMMSEFAIGVRQRSLLPLRLNITEQVRPGQLSLHFDEGAQTYLQSVYAECGLQQHVTWMGLPTRVAPADLISLQQIIHQIRPDAVITVGAEAGLISFIDTTLGALSSDGARILCVNPASSAAAPPTRATVLHGQPEDPHILATAHHWTGSAETVLVLYTAGPPKTFSSATLKAYGDLVSYRSYLICLGTLFGQPWLGYSNHHHLQTIRDFTSGDSPFVIDRSWNQQLISTCPSGYLRKVGGVITAANCDPAMDTFVLDPLPPENVQ